MAVTNIPQVVSRPDRVFVRLIELGLSSEVLRGALTAGLSGHALCTPNHPPIFSGITFWADAVRALREALIPLGWHRNDAFNLSTVVRGDGSVAIAVLRGDSATGNVEANPTTQYARGPVMQRYVDLNWALPFDEPSDEATPEVSADAAPATWILLHYRDGDELRAELSFPLVMNDMGFVESWGERIILQPITLDPTRMPVLNDEPVEPNVDVRRRA